MIDMDYASQYDPIYQKYGEQYNVDPLLLKAQGIQESGLNPSAVGPETKYGQASGIAQLIPDTAERLGVTDPTDPNQAIQAQAKLMAENMKSYKDPNKALSAYHGGTNTDNWGPKTADYVEKVNNHYQKLKAHSGGTTTTQVTTPAAYTSNVTAQSQPTSADDPEDYFAAAKKLVSQQTPPSTSPDSEDYFANAKKLIAQKQDLKDNPDPWYAKPAVEAVAAGKSFSQGLRDVGAGVQKLAGGSTLGGILPTPEEFAAKKAEYEKTWGNPKLSEAGISGATPGRIAGQVVGTAPAIAAGGEVLGAAGAGLSRAVPALEGPVNFLTGNTASNAVTNSAGKVIQGATLGNKAARIASTIPAGATGGAAGNALIGQDPVEGAKVGAAAGPLLSLLGGGVSSLVNKGSSELAPYVDKIKQSLVRDGFTTPSGAVDIAAVQNKLTSMGPHATLADIGPNTRDLAGAVAQAPGEGKNIISSALEERQAGQSDRLKQTVFSGLGLAPQETYESAVPKLIEQRKAQAKPLYDQAFEEAKPVDIKPVIDDIDEQLSTAKGANAKSLENARELLLNKDGDPDTTLKGLHESKLALDHLIESTKRDTSIQRLSDSKLRDVRGKLLDAIDSANPTYAKARAAFSGPSQSLDALDQGTQFIKNGGADNSDQLSKLSEDDKKFFRIGAAKQIKNTIENTPDGADAVKKIFNTPIKRQSLESVFPNKQAFDDFASQAQNESTFYRTKGAIGGNSLTNPRMLSSQDLQSPLQKTVGRVASVAAHTSELAQRNPLGKAVYLGKLGLNKLTSPGTLSQQDAEELARSLITPEGRKAITDALTPAANKSKDLLNSYINALHAGGISAITSNKLNQ